MARCESYLRVELKDRGLGREEGSRGRLWYKVRAQRRSVSASALLA